jgi:hypothetical protein
MLFRPLDVSGWLRSIVEEARSVGGRNRPMNEQQSKTLSPRPLDASGRLRLSEKSHRSVGRQVDQ